jgi:uncharacterized membrane protein YdjX (TVP38/TMEM64 family)
MFVVDPALALLLILLIGIAVGLLMYRYAGSRWLTQFTSTRRGFLTSALVGMAGSFTGTIWQRLLRQAERELR